MLAVLAIMQCGGGQAQTRTGTVRINTAKAVNTFVPSRALGAGVDGLERGDVERVYRPENLKAMLSVGLKPLSYRLRTELGIESWHWNPAGAWSETNKARGYWISSATSNDKIMQCNGYDLPRRGSTIDQANNRSYSRLDDGDTATFWKSNPYLDTHFTHEDNLGPGAVGEAHPDAVAPAAFALRHHQERVLVPAVLDDAGGRHCVVGLQRLAFLGQAGDAHDVAEAAAVQEEALDGAGQIALTYRAVDLDELGPALEEPRGI